MASYTLNLRICKKDWTMTNSYEFKSTNTIQTILDNSIATDNWITEVSLTEGGAALAHSDLLSKYFGEIGQNVVYDVTPVPDPTLYIHNTRIRR